MDNKSAPATIHLKDYSPPDYRIETVNLQFDLEETQTTVKALLTVICNHDRCEGVHPLVLHGRDLRLISIKPDKPCIRSSTESNVEGDEG